MVSIGDLKIGLGLGTIVIAEIGINHNGDLEIAKKLIKSAKEAGCDAVKFQKRTVDVVYTKEELLTPRESPFGSTNGDLKRGLEFSFDQYKVIDEYCKEIGIMWSASPWDAESVDFLEAFDIPFYKLASACITDIELLNAVKATGKPVICSVGMSNAVEIDAAVKILGTENLVLLHCTCLYPPSDNQINLNRIAALKNKYPCEIGYSGHEFDDIISAAAVALGATVIERHFTIDREMWGSDQKASIEPETMRSLINNIRKVEAAMGSSEIMRLPEEEPIRLKLRRFK